MTRYGFAILLMTSISMFGCKGRDQSEGRRGYEAVTPFDSEPFSLIVLKSKVAFAYSSKVHDGVIPVRYSDQTSQVLNGLLARMAPECFVVGADVQVRGSLLYEERGKNYMLDIDELNGVQPLTDSERQTFLDRAPTVRKMRIC